MIASFILQKCDFFVIFCKKGGAKGLLRADLRLKGGGFTLNYLVTRLWPVISAGWAMPSRLSRVGEMSARIPSLILIRS